MTTISETAQMVNVSQVPARTADLDLLMHKVLAREMLDDVQARQMRASDLPAITWSESLTVSLVFIAVMLGLACWRFSTKDY